MVKVHKGRSSGFSLIEMSFVIIIIGLLLSSFLATVNLGKSGKEFRETIENLDLANQALREFYAFNGRYPCPADPTLAVGDVGYGEELVCRSDITDPCPAGLICENDGTRDVDGDGNREFIVIGALPLTSLADTVQFAEFTSGNGYDGQNMKIMYAVTEEMAHPGNTVLNPAPYQIGAVTLKDEFDRDVTIPPRSAHFVIYSHGENARGAYTKNGDQIGDCTLNSVGTPVPADTSTIGAAGFDIEVENCDENDGIFVSSLQSRADNDNYFDDVIRFYTSPAGSLWRYSALYDPAVRSVIHNTNFGSVGVNKNDPAVRLDIDGEILTEKKATVDGGFCTQDPGDPDCVQPENLGGDSMPFTCGAGQAANGVSENQMTCADLFTSFTDVTCPVGPPKQYLTGFSNLGTPSCAPLP